MRRLKTGPFTMWTTESLVIMSGHCLVPVLFPAPSWPKGSNNVRSPGPAAGLLIIEHSTSPLKPSRCRRSTRLLCRTAWGPGAHPLHTRRVVTLQNSRRNSSIDQGEFMRNEEKKEDILNCSLRCQTMTLFLAGRELESVTVKWYRPHLENWIAHCTLESIIWNSRRRTAHSRDSTTAIRLFEKCCFWGAQ